MKYNQKLYEKVNEKYIKKISEKILGKPDELFKIRIDKEKQVALQYAKDTDKLLKENNINKENLNVFFGLLF